MGGITVEVIVPPKPDDRLTRPLQRTATLPLRGDPLCAKVR